MVKSSIQWKRLINEGEPPSGQVITTSLSVTKNKSLILTARFRDKAITLHRNLPSVAEMPLDTDVYYCDWRSTRSLCSLINVLQCRLPDQYEELINCESGLRIPLSPHNKYPFLLRTMLRKNEIPNSGWRKVISVSWKVVTSGLYFREIT